jgi:hypothetical protein
VSFTFFNNVIIYKFTSTIWKLSLVLYRYELSKAVYKNTINGSTRVIFNFCKEANPWHTIMGCYEFRHCLRVLSVW